MRRHLICIMFTLLGIHPAIAQTSGVVSGNVVDATEKRAMPGAVLRLSDSRYTISDRNGHYEFLNVPAGDYILAVEYIGYETASQPVTTTAGNTVVDFTLKEAPKTIGEVVVMGDMSRSQAKALNTQRTGERITNIISSDQMGRFPDSNIGDALRRVPGVAMQGDQGESRNIVIRGMAPQLNSVTLNGNRVPSAEGDNRNVQMDLFPADMIQTVEVSKTLTADMDADAIGGSVNLVTRSAPVTRRISATLLGGYNPIRSSGTWGGSAVYSDRFFNKKLGVVVNGSYHNKKYGSDNVEAAWAQDKAGDIYMKEMDIRKYDVQRIRRSVGANLDWKINAGNTITFDAMYNWRDDIETRYRVRYKSEPKYDKKTGELTSYKNSVSRQTKSGVGLNGTPGRLERQAVQSYALGGRHLVSPKFDLSWNVNFSRAIEHRPGERYANYEVKKENSAITQDISDPSRPSFSQDWAPLDAFKLKSLSENDNYTREDELAARIDARVPMSIIDGQKGRLRFGLRARLKDKMRDNTFSEYKPLGDFPKLTDTDDTENHGALSIDSKYVPGTFYNQNDLSKLPLSDASKFEGELKPEEYLAANYNANERILAAYLRWDQNLTDKLVATVGLRGEHTHTKYTGNRIIDEDYDNATAESRTGSYMNLLPSVSFKYDVRRNLILRAAFTTALSRPNYYDLVPFTNVVSEENFVSAGNPDLKPTYSYNFDVMGEYYFKTVGIFSVGAFYKSLNNFIYKYSDMSYTADKFAADFPGQTNPVSGDEAWEFVRPMNGRNVAVYGFEVAFQRRLDFLPTQFLRNFGVYVNYTYTDSRAKGIRSADGVERIGLRLPGTAPHMLNTSLSWENERFSARVSLNYSGSYLDEIGADAFQDRYYDRQLFLDANASYRVTKWMRIFAEANNLLNTPLRYYQSGVRDRVMQMEYYKPTFIAGLKFEF